jgi:hypothetical protein
MVGNERWHFVRQAHPEEREWLDRAAMIRVGFSMLPRQRRIARVSQVVEMAMLDLLLADIPHVSYLLAEETDELGAM